MNKLKYLLLALTTFFYNCNTKNYQDNKLTQSGIKVHYSNNDSTAIGNLINEKLKSGQWIYYKKGRLSKIISYKNDTFNGTSVAFNYDGSLRIKLCYLMGKLNGSCDFYSSTGKHLATIAYTNDASPKVSYYVAHEEAPPLFDMGTIPTLDSAVWVPRKWSYIAK